MSLSFQFRIVVAVTATYTVVSGESLPIATQPYGGTNSSCFVVIHRIFYLFIWMIRF